MYCKRCKTEQPEVIEFDKLKICPTCIDLCVKEWDIRYTECIAYTSEHEERGVAA